MPVSRRRRAAAGISRSWLYTQPDIRGQIQRMRDTAAKTGRTVPARQRATDARCAAGLTAALERNRQLAEENARLGGNSPALWATSARPRPNQVTIRTT